LFNVYSATYYVSKSGSDSNPGIQSQPWLTITKAASTITAGDIVIIDTGIYSERVVTSSLGTVDNPIIFKVNNGSIVKTLGFLIEHDFIIIDGFEIDGTVTEWQNGDTGITIESNYCQIINNVIYNLPAASGGYGIETEPPSAHCLIKGNILRDNDYINMAISGTYHTIANNTIRDASADAIYIFGHDHNVRNNYFYNIYTGGNYHADLIQTFGDNGEDSYNIIFENNLAKNCTDCQICNIEPKGQKIENWTFRNNIFINVDASANNYAPKFKFYNNTFYHVGHHAFAPQNAIQLRNGTKGTADSCEIKNNLFIDCMGRTNGGWYHIDPGIVGTDADYNYVTGPQPIFDSKSGFNEIHGINGGDPKFFDLESEDFHLLTGSPAIDYGTPISSFDFDMEGISRPQGEQWDIGAYEFPSDILYPLSPKNLRIEP
jgi:hypothetical protein